MEYEIDAIVDNVSIEIKNKPSHRKVIQYNYERIYSAVKNSGYTEFAAHQWAVMKLSRIYGSTKVKNAVRSMQKVESKVRI